MPKGIPDDFRNMLPRLEVEKINSVVDLLIKGEHLESILQKVFFVIPRSRELVQEADFYKQAENGRGSPQQINEARRRYFTKYVRSIEQGLYEKYTTASRRDIQ